MDLNRITDAGFVRQFDGILHAQVMIIQCH